MMRGEEDLHLRWVGPMEYEAYAASDNKRMSRLLFMVRMVGLDGRDPPKPGTEEHGAAIVRAIKRKADDPDGPDGGPMRRRTVAGHGTG